MLASVFGLTIRNRLGRDDDQQHSNEQQPILLPSRIIIRDLTHDARTLDTFHEIALNEQIDDDQGKDGQQNAGILHHTQIKRVRL